MLSNELKSKINKLWNKFYSRGITNPITAIEQISYLLFMRRLDDADALEKAKAIFSEQEYKSFFEGYEDCRWSHFSQLDPDTMLQLVTDKAFPFIKTINDPTQPYSRYMKDAITEDSYIGFEIRVLPSLSGPDEWHYGKGFIGHKQAKAFQYHRTEGEIASFTTTVK